MSASYPTGSRAQTSRVGFDPRPRGARAGRDDEIGRLGGGRRDRAAAGDDQIEHGAALSNSPKLGIVRPSRRPFGAPQDEEKSVCYGNTLPHPESLTRNEVKEIKGLFSDRANAVM
jgi:hypothetical protein